VGRVSGRLNLPRHGEGDHAKRGGGASPPLQRQEVYAARKLRREMSLPEVLLWGQIRTQKIGSKFRRQHPIGPYVADFFCAAARLVVEVDGKNHDYGDRPERDQARDWFMADAGYTVIRIAATDVLRNMDRVLTAIKAATETPLHRFAVPLPASGEDLI
jgi:very-short-patch-repair endonuclease